MGECDDINYIERTTHWFVYAITPFKSFSVMVNFTNVFGHQMSDSS